MAIDFDILNQYSQTDEGLRDYQQTNKQKIYNAWTDGKSVMLQMPTGTGKTRLFVSIIKDIFYYSSQTKKALKVLVLVHRTELIEQIDEELGYKYGLAHGIIQSGDRERKNYPIQLASVQTLNKRLDKWIEKAFDFIIVDEAHHVEAASYQKIIKAFPDALLLGVTATPVRLSGEGFTGTFDELIVSPSVKEFIEEGYLSQYEYYSITRSSFIQKEIDAIKKFSNGDYAESEMERVCDNDRIRAQVVKTYLDFASGKKGIVYTINKLHNKNLCDEFKQNGVKAVAIDSDTPGSIREEYIEQFRRGDYQVICNVNLFTEGFDCPDIEFIQLARPTKSLALYLQQVGRGLRISGKKEKTLFLDNVGLYNRFGFPSSRRMWKHHFEGKYVGNKTADEIEGKKQPSAESLIKRERHPNLEEGNEKIHLIQTTDEKSYLESRKEQLLDWFLKYGTTYAECVNKAYEGIYVNGLELKRKSTGEFEDLVRGYEVAIDKNTEEIDAEKERRGCKNDEDLLHELNHLFAGDIGYYFNTPFKSLSEDFKALQFSKAELMDMVPELVGSKTTIAASPKAIERGNMSFIWIAVNCFLESYYFGLKKYKVYNDIFDIIIENLSNKSENKI